MAVEIRIPRLGWSMEEGVFEGWLKADGDFVKAGEPIFSVEGEKATQDVDATDDGVLRISPDCPKPGDVVPVGTLLGYLVAPGEELPKTKPVEATSVRSVGHQPARLTPELVTGTAMTEALTRSSIAPVISAKSTPRARRAAARAGIEWTQVRGTGRGGRVRERDVVAAAGSAATPPRPAGRRVTAPSTEPAGASIPVTSMRRTIAERMRHSTQVTAPVTLTTTADASNLVNLRAQFLAAEPAEPAPSYTDLFVKLAATALRLHPIMNSRWADDHIVQLPDLHAGVAVHTESGLYVVVIRQTGSLSLRQVAAQSRDLIERARARQLKPEEMTGSTFTITNLGSYGIDAFTPIINPPECAVLGVGRIARRPTVVDNQVVPRDQVTLSLTFDHRIVDGAPAASFLQTLVKLVENPAPALLS